MPVKVRLFVVMGEVRQVETHVLRKVEGHWLLDGQLSPGESFVVELPVGLQSFNPFTFLVDVLGVVEAP